MLVLKMVVVETAENATADGLRRAALASSMNQQFMRPLGSLHLIAAVILVVGHL